MTTDLILIGKITSPDGGTRPWFVTKDIKAKIDAHPFKPKTDFTQCVLARYITFLDEALEGLTPNTPEYEKRRRQVTAWLRAQIEEEEKEDK